MAEMNKGQNEFGVLTACKFLVRAFAAEHDLSTDDLRKLTIPELINWVSESGVVASSEEELLEGGVSPEALNLVKEAFETPIYAVKMLEQLWPALTMIGPPLTVQIASTSITLTLISTDNRAAVLQCAAPWSADWARNEGVVQALLSIQAQDLLKSLATVGIEKLFSEHSRELSSLKALDTSRPGTPGSDFVELDLGQGSEPSDPEN